MGAWESNSELHETCKCIIDEIGRLKDEDSFTDEFILNPESRRDLCCI